MIEKFTPQFRSFVPRNLHRYLDVFEQGSDEMHRKMPEVATAFEPEHLTLPALHNHYVNLLLAAYTAKYTLYANQLISGVNRLDFLAYAAAARGFVEMTAVLRHYVVRKYQPFFDASLKAGTADLRKIIEMHDQHLRGSRFDWERWVDGDLEKLFTEARERHSKKADQKTAAGIQQKQVNVTTCVEKWAAAEPPVLVLYDLLCDLVHPNVGSSLAVASVVDGKLLFGAVTPQVSALGLFVQTFPWLLSIGCEAFGQYITLLASSRYEADQLPPLN